MKLSIIVLVFVFNCFSAFADNGYRLWLRYDPIENVQLKQQYNNAISGVFYPGSSSTILAAKSELVSGLKGLLSRQLAEQQAPAANSIVAGTPSTAKLIASANVDLSAVGNEGYIIRTVSLNGKKTTLITGNTDIGVMYGVYHFLRLLQANQQISNLAITSTPKIKLRLLNHWDNLDRTVERGYAGFSIWDWHRLPGYLDQRYTDYARANASIGINGTVLTNVNANALVLTKPYLEKVSALAKVFRPYGIKVYLTARFSAPVEIGGLKSADPLDPLVQEWWKQKIAEIYTYIPDFGGILVKANSEGQPGPQNYGRSHADGANMFADALAPHGGIVMWRAFVYSNETPDDRFKQAYNEFKPLDGKFRKNVMVQVKNGPIDFQPREPFHPLFGAMPGTPLLMEYQVTQEYLGQATHLVYEAPLFKEVLDADTYSKGAGSTVAKVIDGSLDQHSLTGMAGVANIGNDINWTGHPFAQANWYALGRLAWNTGLSSAQIADEWLRLTFSNKTAFITPVKKLMLSSRDLMVNYMTPLGLHHIMGNGHHYGPAPWTNRAARADWDPVYYHRADSIAIGFDRTATGSNALAQYAPEVRKLYENVNTCPEDYLLWFHRVLWTHKMKSGRNLWDELCFKYYSAVDSVRLMQQTWNAQKANVDADRFEQVKMLLAVQEQEAVWWRDACLLYFQSYSKRPLPEGYEKPAHNLAYYQSLRFPYAPGN
ncbi:alpha-glucuronidase [Segetibacter sp. 3557_3]|uniref:alpha-glucuronidase family glycosyl hydrolase n=1 Tax=Segetibacter sp. 3557_3 TaxID=2547429 RepID=UPI0010591243|nr:alpha-glucuronidase family glycosyl hydrolase [Segetibacter sp. 3557_3]TDH27339.1 alpha-glucuronidase [Segetibacter sp. 3557_3]